MARTYELIDADAAKRKNAIWLEIRGVVVLVAGVLVLLAIAANSGNAPAAPPVAELTPAQIKSSAITLPFDTLARETEKYIGANIHAIVEVVQVQEGSNGRAVLRANMTKGDYGYSDTIWVNYSGPRLLENDMLDLYARVDGRRSYTAIMGNEITLPEVTSLWVEVVKE